LFMHCSLDAFAGGPNGEMDWIHVDDEIFDFAGNQTDHSDMAVYGRKTWEMMEAYWPTAADKPGATKHDIQHSKWYNNVPKVILSNTLREEKLKNTKVLNENLKSEIVQLKKQPGKDIIIFGSPGASHSLMQDDLIDEYWLFINPVLLGNGIPVFKNISQRIRLQLKETHSFNSGVVCVHYEKL
jgi:dihydrofolate reductase